MKRKFTSFLLCRALVTSKEGDWFAVFPGCIWKGKENFTYTETMKRNMFGSKNSINSEPEDAREAFFKLEQQKRHKEKVTKWVFRFCVFVCVLFALFIFYALVLDV